MAHNSTQRHLAVMFFLVCWPGVCGSNQTLINGIKECIPDHDETDGPFCRNRNHIYAPELFYRDSCALCYNYLPPTYFPIHKLRYSSACPGHLLDYVDGEWYYYNVNTSDTNSSIYATINSEGINKWLECCAAAKRCCAKMLSDENPISTDQPYCHRLWDGWQCIPDAFPGQTAVVQCPHHIYFDSEAPLPGCTRYARKDCFSNATWNSQTDYTKCGMIEITYVRTCVQMASYGVSLVTLVPAIIIFYIYKQLRVPRITMHKNLFLALLFNSIVVIVWKATVYLDALDSTKPADEKIIGQNKGACKFIVLMSKYTVMTTYMWMFCEAFYLHKLIVAAFAEEKRLYFYYIIGWVFPWIPVVTYAIIRLTMKDEKCWMESFFPYEWILYVPMLTTVALNFIFLINIIRVLITKLRATHANEPSQYRKAVRAAIVLIPLFGLQFLFTIYIPSNATCDMYELYNYISNLLGGLQGCIVALIFCYFNGEVRYLLKRSWKRRRASHDLKTKKFLNSRMSMSTQMMSVTESPNMLRRSVVIGNAQATTKI